MEDDRARSHEVFDEFMFGSVTCRTCQTKTLLVGRSINEFWCDTCKRWVPYDPPKRQRRDGSVEANEGIAEEIAAGERRQRD